MCQCPAVVVGLNDGEQTMTQTKQGATAILKAAAGAVTAQPEQPRSVFGFLKTYKDQIAAALPKHMSADRMARVATTAIRSTPKLLECTPESLFGAIIQCSQLGLEPSNGLGHAYLLPFDKNEKRGNQWVKVSTEVQLIIGYRGMLDLARRSGQIETIEAHAVYAGDTFECELGLNSKLVHVPAWDNPKRGDPATLSFVYAVAKLKDGGTQFQVMSKAGIDAIRERSKAKNSGPWVTDYEQMALKTVVRRLFKWLPVSVEIQNAVSLDEAADRGEQNAGAILDGDFIREPVQRVEPEDAPSFESVLALAQSATNEDDLNLAADLARNLSEEQRQQIDQVVATRAPDLGRQF